MSKVHKNDNDLSSTELAAVWITYMNNSLLRCTYKYFKEKNEDKEIQPLIEHCINMFEERIIKMTNFFLEGNYPVPDGFKDQDVDINAPRLFTDNFVLHYTLQMCRAGIDVYSKPLPLLSHQDIIDFFVKCISQATEVSKWVTSTMLSKGIFVKSPIVDIPDKIYYVNSDDYLAGLLGGERRGLHIKEIKVLFSNIQTNVIGKALVTGFSQVAESEQVKEYMTRGKKIASKHIEIFSSILKKDNITASTPHWNDMVVTDSVVAPFSDKLMMSIVMYANEGGMGYYGLALALDIRHDIVAKFIRLIIEVRKYGADGIKIKIKNGWFEQPPQAIIPSA